MKFCIKEVEDTGDDEGSEEKQTFTAVSKQGGCE